jgi:hypothetical protein
MRAVRICVSINICKIYYSGGGRYKITKWCYRRQWLCPNLRHHPNICLQGCMKTMRNIGHDSWSLDWGWTQNLLNTKLSTCSLCKVKHLLQGYHKLCAGCQFYWKGKVVSWLVLHSRRAWDCSAQSCRKWIQTGLVVAVVPHAHTSAAMFSTWTHVDWWCWGGCLYEREVTGGWTELHNEELHRILLGWLN